MKASTTKLSLDYLREGGWTAEVVERWIPGIGTAVKQDLFGFIDIVAIRNDVTMGVQTTTKGEMPKRVRKILAAEHLGAVSEAGWLIVVHGWWLYTPPPGGGHGRKHYEVEEYTFPRQLRGVV